MERHALENGYSYQDALTRTDGMALNFWVSTNALITGITIKDIIGYMISVYPVDYVKMETIDMKEQAIKEHCMLEHQLVLDGQVRPKGQEDGEPALLKNKDARKIKERLSIQQTARSDEKVGEKEFQERVVKKTRHL